jgi:DNA-directed RNA polymerase specialized sigma24 family protein
MSASLAVTQPGPPVYEPTPAKDELVCRVAGIVASNWRIARHRDDVFQEAALACVKALASNPTADLALLVRVATSAVIDCWRKESRHEVGGNPYYFDDDPDDPNRALLFQRWQFDKLFERPPDPEEAGCH